MMQKQYQEAKVSFETDRLTRREAATFLGLKVSTLAADVTTKRLKIPMYRIGRKVFYKKSELQDYIDKCQVSI